MATTAPLPTISLRTTDSDTAIALHVQITVSDTLIGGCLLLPLSLLSSLVNGYLTWLVCRDWAKVRGSLQYRYYLLVLLLTVADLLFALLVGIPAGLHLTWIEYFGQQDAMTFYSRVLGYFIFEYIFLLRVIIIAALSVDGSLTLLFPLRYTQSFVTELRAKCACALILILPLLLRVIPAALHLWARNLSVICLSYVDPAVPQWETHGRHMINFSVPLTCGTQEKGGKHDPESESTFSTVELVMLASITILAWLLILLTNTYNLAKVFTYSCSTPSSYTSVRVSRENSFTAKERARACLLVAGITASFMLTNFPYLCVWWADYIFRTDLEYTAALLNDRQKFYLTLLTFLSFLFHPWLYFFRLGTSRTFIARIKNAVFNIARDASRDISTKLSSSGSTSWYNFRNPKRSSGSTAE